MRTFPLIRDLDPLQISDAGPCSILLELIGGGEDAEIRHIGETLKADGAVERIVDAPRSSLLSCIAGKLAILFVFLTLSAGTITVPSGAGANQTQVANGINNRAEGAQIVASSPEQFSAFIKTAVPTVADVLGRAGIKPGNF